VRAVDEKKGCLFVEYLGGGTVRDRLRRCYNEKKAARAASAAAAPPVSGKGAGLYGAEGEEVAVQVGRLIVSLHATDLIHGDLTTSNLMYSSSGVPHLIDFGLSGTSTSNEDRAVDLHVLERAIASTHPESGDICKRIMSVYKNESKHGDKVMVKLADVRARGRKRAAQDVFG